MKLSNFKFKLPEDRIALYPTANRDEARLMIVNRKNRRNRTKTVFQRDIEFFR